MQNSRLAYSLFDSLPGKTLSVAQVVPTLTHIWQTDKASTPESHCRASQLNLIVHFGSETLPEQAQVHIQTALDFAQRYPCRIIVLCPEEPGSTSEGLRAKLFSQCFMQSGNHGTVCCDVLTLGYAPRDSAYLTNQVSVWVDNDLPTYHWFCGVKAQDITQRYLSFVPHAKRILLDTAFPLHEGQGYTQIPWPAGTVVRDLAYARTLGLRQIIGQHLSQYTPQMILEDLRAVRAIAHPQYLGEAHALMDWLRLCLHKCAATLPADSQPAKSLLKDLTFEVLTEDVGEPLRIALDYGSVARWLKLAYYPATGQGALDLKLGQSVHYALALTPMLEPLTLAQAIFF